jgi:hypothetical protein
LRLLKPRATTAAPLAFYQVISCLVRADPANEESRKITERYASDQDLFFKDFAGFMNKDCSLVGVNNREELVDPFPPPPRRRPGGPPPRRRK